MVLPMVTYYCETYTIKKAEHRRIHVFKLWCWRRLLRVSDREETKPVNLKGNQPWLLTGRTDAVAEAPVFWSPDVNSWLIGKVPDAGKDWEEEEKRASEEDMAGWTHWYNGHELGKTSADLRDRGLACSSPWSPKESDTAGQLNNITDKTWGRKKTKSSFRRSCCL